ncbi:C-C motif chemokine 5-like [Sebastes umbrosus]|uniref:C-C motif chemokine 5-like n=1 Tax=Sebastes umbrosus TaxID=72105 RepID=UPI00189D08D4|nr:C-C motif chemokine 5-like [Sebastes umbrosus]
MKTAVTLVLLICFLHDSCTGPVAQSAVNSKCCPGHTRKHIPQAHVRHVGMTGSNCASRAIVFTTVCNLAHCIDPDWDWAKNQLKKFNESSGPPFNTKRCARN